MRIQKTGHFSFTESQETHKFPLIKFQFVILKHVVLYVQQSFGFNGLKAANFWIEWTTRNFLRTLLYAVSYVE
jgi:hypothetical protein